MAGGSDEVDQTGGGDVTADLQAYTEGAIRQMLADSRTPAVIGKGGRTTVFLPAIELRSGSSSADPPPQLRQSSEGVAALEALLDRLVESHGERFGRQQLCREVLAVLNAARIQPAYNVAAGVAMMLTALAAYDVEHTLHVPLVGVALLSDNPLPIGNVELVRITMDRKEEMTRSLRAAVERANAKGDELGSGFYGGMLAAAESLDGHTCARYSVVAEPNRARERAEAEARRAVDMLRLLIPDARASNEHFAVGLQGEVPAPSTFLSIVGRDPAGTVLQHPARVPLATLRLDERGLARLNAPDLRAMSDLVRARDGDLTATERGLVRSMHWLGNGISQVDPANGLLNLITAAEVLVGGDPIAETLAVRMAVLLETDPDEQAKLCELIVRLHAQRSLVSHQGSLEASAADVEELSRRVLTVFSHIIERRGAFPTKTALGRYCDAQPNAEVLRARAKRLVEELRGDRSV